MGGILRSVIMVASLVISSATCASAAGNPSTDTAGAILDRFAADWRGRQELPLDRPFMLAFWVHGRGGGNLHVVLSSERGARIDAGAPADYDIGFALDIDLLRRLDRGAINALTAMGQARSNDPIPLTPSIGPRLESRPDAALWFRRVAFHFWNKDWPETIPFNETAARLAHGGNASVLVYDQAFRTAWYQLKPGMHINADPLEQTSEFPQLIVVTRGELQARFDGATRVIAEGNAVLVPPGMRHEFWVDADGGAELIWIAFGDGA